MSHHDAFQLIVPPFTLAWYPEGQHCEDAQDGDMLLVDHGTMPSKLIERGQEILALEDPSLRGFTWCAHAARIRGKEMGFTMVREMGWKGYESRKLWDYRANLYCVVRFKVPGDMLLNACLFDASFSTVDYGWSEYLPFIEDGILGSKFVGTWGDSVICSTKEAMVNMAMGFMPAQQPVAVAPVHIAKWVGARQ